VAIAGLLELVDLSDPRRLVSLGEEVRVEDDGLLVGEVLVEDRRLLRLVSAHLRRQRLELCSGLVTGFGVQPEPEHDPTDGHDGEDGCGERAGLPPRPLFPPGLLDRVHLAFEGDEVACGLVDPVE
jgi:hypothetical protein